MRRPLIRAHRILRRPSKRNHPILLFCQPALSPRPSSSHRMLVAMAVSCFRLKYTRSNNVTHEHCPRRQRMGTTMYKEIYLLGPYTSVHRRRSTECRYFGDSLVVLTTLWPEAVLVVDETPPFAIRTKEQEHTVAKFHAQRGSCAV